MKNIVYPFPAGREGVFLKQIRQAIIDSKLLIFPTETFYGLGGNALNKQVANAVFQLKGRQQHKPFPVLIAGLPMLLSLATEITPLAQKLMERCWPGPLTLIFAARPGLPAGVVSVEQKIAVRVSSHPLVQQLFQKLEVPLIATSANLSAAPAVSSFTDLSSGLVNQIDLAINGGRCPGEQPSTIIDVSEPLPRLIRAGTIPFSDSLYR
ncbi:MAG: threonylcarbamoyl-AMP synthase [Deltaproteobacteria bacterium]|nr:threonylcarbamoyl-AMP synthase [Candidatus Anaeroferrophillus wilburensis]MBN2888457.1 threonylcarbamoyl-AMP synthase [Deltaproteobacteria bacterium]